MDSVLNPDRSMCGPGIHDGGVVRREKQSNLETMAAETKLARVVGLIGFKKKRLNRYNEWEAIPDIVKKKIINHFRDV